jgi:NAD(P)-dependent dehydrogenase (short-subunit alcohol dehydrogenase family)
MFASRARSLTRPCSTALLSTFPNASIAHAYASTEAGVGFAVNAATGFTRSLAREVGKLGITVHAIALGFIATLLAQDPSTKGAGASRAAAPAPAG